MGHRLCHKIASGERGFTARPIAGTRPFRVPYSMHRPCVGAGHATVHGTCVNSTPTSGVRSPAAVIAERIRRLLRVTPLVHAPALGRRIGADVWLKLESLQRTGSFKLRGAAARLCALALAHEARRGQGMRAGEHRAGDHRLGGQPRPGRGPGGPRTSAWTPRCWSRRRPPRTSAPPSPRWAPTSKWSATTTNEAEDEARRRAAADPGLTFVSPFDDDHVIAGNGGLLARELLAQLPDVEAVVCPVGGGGLAGGLGVELVPRGIRLLGVSPEANCAMKRSLEEGRAFIRYDGGPTLAEGLEGGVSERTFRMAQDYCPDIALVSEVGHPQGHRLRLPHAGPRHARPRRP